ncbi:hypothetical protein [Actinotalea sp. K2]|uniref:hypothetical protein n=1 Tax=Actinotalea sp. K2 TaxID=2939438 RepID=UPI0020182EFC|nr:hypothetical protein [Actinotalea sp. K2]MCL3862785.1 hypothetical protein [Actinotalea sp. K2]
MATIHYVPQTTRLRLPHQLARLLRGTVVVELTACVGQVELRVERWRRVRTGSQATRARLARLDDERTRALAARMGAGV